MSDQEAILLRIYVSEKDRKDGNLVYERIVDEANDFGISGATVLRGILGYGAERHIHSAKVLRLSDNLPLVIEIIDEAQKIEGFLPRLKQCVNDGVITKEKVQILK